MSLLTSEEYYSIVGNDNLIDKSQTRHPVYYTKDGKYVIKRYKLSDSCCFNEIMYLKEVSHPNIISMVGYFKKDGNLDLILEKGECDLLGVKFSNKELRLVIYQLLKALSYLHNKHIIHTDIKPDNVLLFRTGEDDITVKLCDFESCEYVINDKEYHNYVLELQTLWYRSPEIYKKQSYNYSIDIWSLGVTILLLVQSNVCNDFFRNSPYSINSFLLRFYSKILDDIPDDIRVEPCILDIMVRSDILHSDLLCIITDMLKWNANKRLTADQLLFKHFAELTVTKIHRNISLNYTQNKNQDVTCGMRYILYNWMWDTVDEYKAKLHILIRSFILCEMYTSRNTNINRQNYQLIGTSAIMIMCDIYNYPISLSVFFHSAEEICIQMLKTMHSCSCFNVASDELYNLNSISNDQLHVLTYLISRDTNAVSYTHLTLPTKAKV